MDNETKEKDTLSEHVNEYIKSMMENDLLAVVFPQEKTEEAAKATAGLIDSAIGVAEFYEDDGSAVWGVLIDKKRQSLKNVKEDDLK